MLSKERRVKHNCTQIEFVYNVNDKIVALLDLWMVQVVRHVNVILHVARRDLVQQRYE